MFYTETSNSLVERPHSRYCLYQMVSKISTFTIKWWNGHKSQNMGSVQTTKVSKNYISILILDPCYSLLSINSTFADVMLILLFIWITDVFGLILDIDKPSETLTSIIVETIFCRPHMTDISNFGTQKLVNA